LTPRLDCLGKYGDRFGIPELKVTLSGNKIDSILVKRGAPCGATWQAAESLMGTNAKDAEQRYGLEVQFLCVAGGISRHSASKKNPIHIAAEVHQKSLRRALSK
jgi:thymidylate synthase